MAHRLNSRGVEKGMQACALQPLSLCAALLNCALIRRRALPCGAIPACHCQTATTKTSAANKVNKWQRPVGATKRHVRGAAAVSNTRCACRTVAGRFTADPWRHILGSVPVEGCCRGTPPPLSRGAATAMLSKRATLVATKIVVAARRFGVAPSSRRRRQRRNNLSAARCRAALKTDELA